MHRSVATSPSCSCPGTALQWHSSKIGQTTQGSRYSDITRCCGSLSWVRTPPASAAWHPSACAVPGIVSAGHLRFVSLPFVHQSTCQESVPELTVPQPGLLQEGPSTRASQSRVGSAHQADEHWKCGHPVAMGCECQAGRCLRGSADHQQTAGSAQAGGQPQ